MERLKEFLDWHCENPHNVNFKMIVAKEDREETLNGMHEMSKLLDTGLTPEQILELKERDTAKVAEKYDYYGYFECLSCGEAIYAGDDFESHKFCKIVDSGCSGRRIDDGKGNMQHKQLQTQIKEALEDI